MQKQDRWFEPDKTWEAIGVRDFNHFLLHYVVEGKFHLNVPDDIVKSYKTSEFLMAHSWYHWPMYDEAMKKLLITLEAAVKIKYNQLGIKIKKEKGPRRQRTLIDFIDDISLIESEKNLQVRLQAARKLRNGLIHGEGYSFMGGLWREAFISSINLINMLFLDYQFVLDGNRYLSQLHKDYRSLFPGPVVLNWMDYKYLISTAWPLSTLIVNQNTFTFWVFHGLPINLLESISNSNYPPPFILCVKNISFQDDIMTGEDVSSNSILQVSPSKDSLDNAKFEGYKSDMSTLTDSQMEMYQNSVNYHTNTMIAALTYSHCWH